MSGRVKAISGYRGIPVRLTVFCKQLVLGAIADAAVQAVIDKALHGRNIVITLLILADHSAHVVARIGTPSYPMGATLGRLALNRKLID